MGVDAFTLRKFPFNFILEKNCFVLLPVAGLANRLRAINSAIELNKILKKKLYVIWGNNDELNSNYSTFFKKNNSFILIEDPIKFNFLWLNPSCLSKRDRILNTFFKQISFSKVMYHEEFRKDINNTLISSETLVTNLKAESNIFIESDFNFYKNSNFHHNLLDNILDEVNIITKDFKETIGLHIRRTDHFFAIENSPIDKFIQIIDNEIKKNNNANFYLSTDSVDVKNELIKKFAKRIHTNNFELNRNTEIGIKNAILDLYSLSKTSKIIGSKGSSFTDMAGQIGNVEVAFP